MRHAATMVHTGLFWLFMGCANSDAKLYDEELQELAATYPDQFRIDYALSREQTNARGGKMYIQVRFWCAIVVCLAVVSLCLIVPRTSVLSHHNCASPQDKLEEYADEVFDLLDNGAHIYFCGLKGMMPGILETLERVAKGKGLNWEEFFEGLKHKNQWHVEVY